MKLLLDTHIWLWSILEPDRLTPRVLSELATGTNELWLSPISVWETMLLLERGRLSVDGDPHGWVREALRVSPVRAAPFTNDVAIMSCLLRLPHRDPADRFLAATAKVYELTLVTADGHLASGDEYDVLPNQ